jgi:uncharacterized protein (TIGR03437 family)
MKHAILLACTAIVVCSAQVISTIAGGGLATGDGGKATSANIQAPSGVTVDSAGNVYFIETTVPKVRKIDTAGIITTFAGNGMFGIGAVGDGGPATNASFAFSGGHEGIAVDSSGNVYITDSFNSRIRKVDTNGNISTFGSGLLKPSGVAVDASGNVYVAEPLAARVLKITPSGTVTTFAGNGAYGHTGDGGPATSASVGSPMGVAVDGAGNVYFSDQSGYVRKVATDGTISTLAGNGTVGFSGDGGPGINAQFFSLIGIGVDSSGVVYVVDNNNKRIRKIALDGTITTFAGNGRFGTGGDGGLATNATFETPNDVFVDSRGSVYISDAGQTPDGRIRKVAAAPAAPGSVTLVANAFGDTPLIAPNTWVEIKGTNLAPPGDSRIWQGPDFTGNKLPTQLDGVSVTVNGKPAYLYYISSTQVNILTPPDAMSGTVQVQLTNAGAKSNSVSVQAQAQSLSFFEFVSSDSKHYIYGRHSSDSGLIGPRSLFAGLTTPVKPGESIFIAANGFGPTDTPVVSGSLTQSGLLPTPLPVIKIGGIPADVSFAGLAGVGTYQINLTVPPGVPDGDNAIIATFSGLNTQQNLQITVQH